MYSNFFSRLISLTNEKVAPDFNPANLSIVWAGKHAIRHNSISVTNPYYAVHMLLVAEYHQHEVVMSFGLHTRLCSQQTGTGHGIVGHSRAEWRCNTGVYTRGLGDTTGTCKGLSITTKTIQWSISVALFTIRCRYRSRQRQKQNENVH